MLFSHSFSYFNGSWFSYFSMKTDTKFLFTLERNVNKLFESTKKLVAIPSEPDALILFHDRPYIA